MGWKATLRSAVLLGLLALSAPSFAEVQNVKVGGDITERAFIRSNLDLHQEGTGGTNRLDGDNFFTSTVGLNVGADLTENVSTFVRLTNERDWNLDGNTGGGDGATAASSRDFALSQGYISLKELFYSPLTLKGGKQPIRWGRGFVLGSSLIPGILTRGDDLHGSLTPNEFTDFTAFDAVRATLDLSHFSLPLSVDYVYIKINENNPGAPDDVNMQGVNISSHFDAWNSEAETYFLNKTDKSGACTIVGSCTDQNGSVSTIGIRGSTQPVEGSLLYGELGYQFGTRGVDPMGVLVPGDRQQAWAFDIGAEYTLTSVAMTPKLGAEWIYWSGKSVGNNAAAGWDPMARGYYTTALREFQTANGTAFYGTDQANDTSAATNESQFGFYGSLKPIQDLTAASRLSFFFLPVSVITIPGSSESTGYAGAEWDTNIVYNYTDDVQLGLLYAVFAPGNIYRTPNDSTAQELVSTVSVKF